MKLKLFPCLTALLCLCLPGAAQDTSEALKSKLEDRYKGQKVNVVPANVIVAFADVNGPAFFVSDRNFSAHYDHFFEGVEVPKRYQERDHFDERTTQQVEATAALYSSTMEAGEALEI